MSVLGNPTWYHQLIRKYIVVFGRIFSDIEIQRTINGNRTQIMVVPLTYAAKEKMLTRVATDPNIDRQTAIILPVMSFEIDGIRYDGSRKLPTVTRIATPNADKNVLNYGYSPVPYNIDMKLYVYVKNNEDGTKIIEQILPFFTPDWTISMNLVPELGVTQDVPIVLNNVSFEDSYDGDFRERRAIIWTLDFTIKGYFYGPVRKSGVIKFVNTNIHIVTTNTAAQSVGVDPASAKVTIQPGLLANGSPTTNSQLTIPYSEISINDDYGYVTVVNDPIINQ